MTDHAAALKTAQWYDSAELGNQPTDDEDLNMARSYIALHAELQAARAVVEKVGWGKHICQMNVVGQDTCPICDSLTAYQAARGKA